MGQQEDVSGDLNDEVYREFMRALLRDVRALDRLIDEGQIEEGIRRIGVEQEMFLVDSAWRPAPMSKEVLGVVDDSDVTTELAKFNLEINVPPLVLGRTSLRDLEASLNDRMRRVRDAAASLGCEVLITGTLPTLTPSDLGLENMTESPRYRALNDALMRLRGRDYELRIQGTDDLLINSPTVMPEA